MTGGNGPSCSGWVTNVSIRPSAVGISTKRSFTAPPPLTVILRPMSGHSVSARTSRHLGSVEPEAPPRPYGPGLLHGKWYFSIEPIDGINRCPQASPGRVGVALWNCAICAISRPWPNSSTSPARPKPFTSPNRPCRIRSSSSRPRSVTACSTASASGSSSPRRASSCSAGSSTRCPRSTTGSRAVRGSAQQLSGNLRIGVTHTFNVSLLPTCIDLFFRKHPSVRVTVQEQNAESVGRGVEARRFRHRHRLSARRRGGDLLRAAVQR